MSVTLQPNALLTVAEYKAWLTIAGASLQNTTEFDEVITDFINTVSDDFASICRREFRQADLEDEAYDGDGSALLWLRRPPVDPASVTLRIVDGGQTLETLIPVRDFAVPAKDEHDGRVVLRAGTFPPGYANVLASYTGGYDAIPSRLRQAAREGVHLLRMSAGKDGRVYEEGLATRAMQRRKVTRFGYPVSIMTMLSDYILNASVAVHGMTRADTYRRRLVPGAVPVEVL